MRQFFGCGNISEYFKVLSSKPREVDKMAQENKKSIKGVASLLEFDELMV